MAESSTTTETSDNPSEHMPNHSANTAGADAPSPSSPAPRRKVYESTLFADKRRRRTPGWVLLVVLAGVVAVLAYMVFGNHGRRHVATAGKIIYAAADTPGGVTRLYIAGINGVAGQPISQSLAAADNPAFSPDGDQIAYTASTSNGDRQVFVMDADGKNPQQITNNTGSKSSPSFAPVSNQLLAYTSGGSIFTSDLGTGDTERVLPPAEKDDARGGGKDADTNQNDITKSVVQYAWSPGAKKRVDQELAAAVETNFGQVLSILPGLDKDPIDSRPSPDGKTSFPLAVASTMTVNWSPDGGLIAVAAMGANPGSTILLFTADGEPTQKQILDPRNFIKPGSKVLYGPEHPIFSPDGDVIVYEKWAQPDLITRHSEGLYSLDVSGDAPPKPILSGEAEKAQFTPDGQSLLCLVKRADGGHDLWQVGVDGSNPHRVSNGTQDITEFAISPQKG